MPSSKADESPNDTALTGRGGLDKDFLDRIGGRIRELRTVQSLTVQQLADRVQISRRLMTQIELGQANPSLVTVTRIARQLGTEFTALLDAAPPESPIEAHASDGHLLVWRSEAGSSAHLLESAEAHATDLWLWRLAPGDTYLGRADPARSHELFYVLSGAVTLRADDTQVTLAAGESARMRSDRPYSYSNVTDTHAEFVRTVSLAS